MHALHRPHLPCVMTVTSVGAVLAIVLSLALATGLNDLASTPALTGPVGTSLQAPAPGHGWNVSPFASLLSAPAAVPWAPAKP